MSQYKETSRKFKVFLIAMTSAIGSALLASAQVSASIERFSPLTEGYFERARTMLESGNYLGVIDQLSHLHTQGIKLSEADQEQYIYMLAQAYYERGDSECLNLLREFATEYPASPLALKAKLSIADYYFFHHQWQEALAEYEKVDFNRLNHSDLPLYSYRRALTLIKTGHYKEAKEYLAPLANNRQYQEAYTFYTAYLNYIDGDYNEAYNLFSKVKTGENGLEASYYLTQIEYIRGNYDTVIERGPGLVTKLSDSELAPELNRITGLSYFKRGDYLKARNYLNSYVSATDDSAASDAVYALAVIDYSDGDLERAADRFSTLTDLNNDLAQSAWLYLGQCDVKTGNDDAAAMAFEKAARMDFDKDVSETALYNYVAASTRGGKVPFSSSVDLLEGFIKLYPHSEYTPKVEEYLATAYYNEKNYSKAIESINKIPNPSASVLTAKQKVLYELGIEAMNNGRAADAADYLKQSLKLSSYDRKLAAQTELWLGDAEYSLGNYAAASSAYTTFLKTEQNTSNRSLALYNLGYSEYMQEKYSAGATQFTKATEAKPALPQTLYADALIRLADCKYYTGDYKGAQKYYKRALDEGTSDADYAMYRHAVMCGLAGDINGKLRELTEMQSRYPDSKWMPNALLEKALTYEALDNSTKAAEAFDELASSYPRSAQARKAMINLAQTYAKSGKMDKATETYKEIIRTWPSSDEASIANDDLKRYYASQGSLQEYVAFLRTVPGAKQLDASEMEQLSFDGAETAFADNASDISLLQNYVRDYPDGKYLAQALLDIAYSLRDSKRYEQAEEALNRLISERPHSAQYPEALLMKAEILENNIPGRSSEAAAAYKDLEMAGETDFIADACAGVARTSSNPSERLEYARKTQRCSGVLAEEVEEMRLIEAEALISMNRKDEGVEILTSLASNPASEAGARAAVALGNYYLENKEFAAAEKAMLEFTEAGTPHQLQLAHGFIILADAYQGMGKAYLAKEYLQSLKENYPGSEKEIIDSINSRLKALNSK